MFEKLIAYLNMLDNLNRGEYACHREIAECIEAIRKELGLAR
jgi:hypothetical protein